VGRVVKPALVEDHTALLAGQSWHQATLVYRYVLEREVRKVDLEHFLLYDPAPHRLASE